MRGGAVAVILLGMAKGLTLAPGPSIAVGAVLSVALACVVIRR